MRVFRFILVASWSLTPRRQKLDGEGRTYLADIQEEVLARKIYHKINDTNSIMCLSEDA